MAGRIKVAVAGALGRMGLETVRAVAGDGDLELVGAADVKARGERLAELANLPGLDLVLDNDVEEMARTRQPEVIIDFTNPQAVYQNARVALVNGITAVIGTTGLNDFEIKELERLSNEKGVGVAIIPNFAIGAALMMMFAREAAKYLPHVEIVELHHDQKLDAPSGTAIKTAEMICESTRCFTPRGVQEMEKIPGSRGGKVNDVRIHSIRLPGLVAHQEVIFGGQGQCLTIRHDSYNRESFMPGVLLAVKKMYGRKGMVYGLERLL